MRINLNDPSEFTIENLSKLIATEDDSVNTQLRVTKDDYLSNKNAQNLTILGRLS